MGTNHTIPDSTQNFRWAINLSPDPNDQASAIGECSELPGIAILNAQPRWVLFMPWAELVKEANNREEIVSIYNNPGLLTLDDMPGWK